MSSFLVNMDDGSERSILAYNVIDSDGDLILVRSFGTSFENLFTAVMDIKRKYPCYQHMALVQIGDSSAAIILPIKDENNSILFMNIPQNASTSYLEIDEHGKLTNLFGYNIPVIFTHLTELEYTFL